MASPLTSPIAGEPTTPQQAEALLAQIADAEHALSLLTRGAGDQRPTAANNRQQWAERRYRALVEQIPVVTFLAALDHDVHELYVSPQIQDLLGFTHQQWLENPFLWYNQLHPDDRQRWADEFARTCASGTQFRSEYRFLARDGRVVWVHGECQVIRDESGTPLFLQGIAYDITEIKTAQEVLERTSQELERRVAERTAELREQVRQRQRLADQLAEEGRRKDQFVAVLAHELRNPLAPILPALQLLKQTPDDPQAHRVVVETVSRQVGQMSRLIDDLVDISRISRGKVALQKSRIDAGEVVERTVEVARPLAAKCRHTLNVRRSSQPMPLNADALRLEQVITNLLTNAIKFTDPGGVIEMTLDREGPDAVIRVRDNGRGIPAPMLEKVFEMFTQVDSSLGRSTQSGLGIGLALVRGLVELHGGTVDARSEGSGKGSEFTVRLPIETKPADMPSARPASPTSHSLTPRKILIVDDNTDAGRVLGMLLRSWGQEVRVVHEGASALLEVRTDPPEIVLLDIGLPEMDGYQVIRKLRQNQSETKPIVIAVTGYGSPEDRQRAAEEGFDLHMTKPIDLELLRDLLVDPRRFLHDHQNAPSAAPLRS